jgi:hypothetical protein
MKTFLLLIIILLVSCGDRRETTIEPRRDFSSGDITLKASRTYNPNNWFPANMTSSITGDFTMPSVINVQNEVGNAGTGWTSITVGDRKFCYQGDAASDVDTSDQFFLIKEKNNILANCNDPAGDITFDLIVIVEQGDLIKMELHGGGCSLINPITCQNTEIGAVLEAN